MQVQRGLLGDDGPQQLGHFLNQRIQVEHLNDELAPPGVGQHLLGQLGGALGRLLDLPEHGASRRFVGELHQGQAGIAQDGGEQIVEIVGDAAGQHAQAFQLLGMLNLGFEFAALFLGACAIGDINDSCQHHQPVAGRHRDQSDFDREFTAIFANPIQVAARTDESVLG